MGLDVGRQIFLLQRHPPSLRRVRDL